MALISHLSRRVVAPALLRASGPRFPPPPSSRLLSYGSAQGRRHRDQFPSIDDVIANPLNYSLEEHHRVFKMVMENHDRVMRRGFAELDATQEATRRAVQRLKGSYKRFLKIADGIIVICWGACAVNLALGRYTYPDVKK